MSKYNIEEVKNYCFFMIPQSLVTNKTYKKLNANAKILYSVLFNRMQLSIKNNFTNENGDIYIIFSRKEMAETMNCSLKSIINYMNELKEYGLVEEKRRGLGLKNLIFLHKPKNAKTYKKVNASQDMKEDTTHYNNTYSSNTNNNNNKDTNNLKDTTNNNETVNNESVVVNSNSTEQESNTQVDKHEQEDKSEQESNDHEQTNKSEQDNRFYKLDDVKRLFSLAKQVSSSITMSLIKNLLKHYSYKQIQEKLLYMQKFKQRNTIYNPNGFLVSALRDNYTFVDKAKVILDKANIAIQKTKEYLTQFRNNDVADRDMSLNYLQSMKLQLQSAY